MSQTASLPPSPSSRHRLVSIQVCRGLAAIFVVLAHLHNVELKYFPTNMMGIFQYGVLGVDLFFVISGIVISAVTVGRFSNRRYAGTFLYHRLARIFPVYWVYTAIVLVAFLYNPLWINAGAGHRVNILASFLLIPTNLGMLVMQGWTLSFELYFYFVFFLLLFFAPEKNAPFFLTFWGVFIAIAALMPVPVQPILGLITSPSVFEFLAGCLIFHLYRRGVLWPKGGFVLITVAFIWLGTLMAWSRHSHGSNQIWIEHFPWIRLGLYGSFSSIFLLGIMELERSGFIRFVRPLSLIGDWSYSIYLSHLIVIELVGRIIFHFAVYPKFAMVVVDGVALPLVLLVGYLSYTLLERPLINLLNKKPAKTLAHSVS
ncbi:acyltransferase family protein [Tunturiibacter lichenicola]|uniref:acyltransferase family protein n=1 Tax=Tunturiibacter lichenicola TaxID=2051959 RepID=UPI0021B1E8B5|nr:acyltransferase [Edaphobacter lichenicola]